MTGIITAVKDMNIASLGNGKGKRAFALVLAIAVLCTDAATAAAVTTAAVTAAVGTAVGTAVDSSSATAAGSAGPPLLPLLPLLPRRELRRELLRQGGRRLEAGGGITIGVPIALGCSVALLLAYWFFFLRETGEEPPEEEQTEAMAAAMAEGIKVSALPAIKEEGGGEGEGVTPKGPPIWIEYMQHRESKSFAHSPEERTLARGASKDDYAYPVMVRQHSSFAPALSASGGSAGGGVAAAASAGAKGPPRQHSGHSRSSSRSTTPPPTAAPGAKTSPAPAPAPADIWRRGTISFSDAHAKARSSSASKGKGKGSPEGGGRGGHRRDTSGGNQSFQTRSSPLTGTPGAAGTAGNSSGGNFFDAITVQGESLSATAAARAAASRPPSSNPGSGPGPGRGSHSSIHLTGGSAGAGAGASAGPSGGLSGGPSHARNNSNTSGVSGASGMTGASRSTHTTSPPPSPSPPRSPMLTMDRSRSSVVEYFLGESRADRARAGAAAERLEAGLRSLSLVVDLDDCPPNDFRKMYSLLSDGRKEESKGGGSGGGAGAGAGGMLSFFTSFNSFSKPAEEGKDGRAGGGKSPVGSKKKPSSQKGTAAKAAKVRVILFIVGHLVFYFRLFYFYY
jgi:hypothetical protein